MKKYFCLALLSFVFIALICMPGFAAKQCEVGLEDVVAGGGKYAGTLTLQNTQDKSDYATMYIETTKNGDTLELRLPKKHWINFFSLINAKTKATHNNGAKLSEGASLQWKRNIKSKTKGDVWFSYNMQVHRCIIENLDALVFAVEQQISGSYKSRDNVYMLVPRDSAIFLLKALKSDSL